MSIDATKWAWEITGIKSMEKLVLLTLADRADENCRCYPSASRMSQDTCADRKTILKAINSLISHGLIKKTGEFRGSTKSTPVYELIGVPVREKKAPKSSAKSGTGPKSGTGTKNGMGSSTKNGIPKQYQKRDTEPLSINLSINHNNPPIPPYEKNSSSTSQIDEVNAQGSEADCSDIKKPKKQKVDFNAIKESWNEVAVQNGLSRSLVLTDKIKNNIRKLIVTARQSDRGDYSDTSRWSRYFSVLISESNRIEPRHKKLEWATRPETYRQLLEGVYQSMGDKN